MIKISRKSRETLNASFFHVIIQGHKKEFIFRKTRYIYQYIKLIKKHIKGTNIKIIAYCIMGNHAHFLFQVDELKNLSKLMQKINTEYANYYNHMEDGRVGHVYRDRFMSQPITSQKYLVQCIKYIHFNPVKAHIVDKCEQYQFSSYNYFCKKLKENNNNSCFSVKEYKDICENVNYEIEFMDIEKEEKEIIVSGIQEFINKHKYNIFQIFNNREVLTELVKYLKDYKKITYLAIGDFFGMSRGCLQNIVKKAKNINKNMENT